MSIRHEQVLEVPRTPAECFAFVDDFENAPRWNPYCVKLVRSDETRREVGSTVTYTYQSGREGVMTGIVAEREPGKLLVLRLSDKLFEVTVGFRFDATGGGTRITHWMEVTTRSLMAKLMSPMIRLATKKQITGESEALAKLLAR